MKKNIANENLKAGHPMAAEAHPKFPEKDIGQDVPEIEIEKDADDQIHDSMQEIVIADETDLDDVIHQQPATAATENNEADFDDLVHRKG